MKIRALSLCLVVAALCGCSSLTIVAPDGTKITRTSFLTNPTIGPMKVTKGDTTFSMDGYGHNQTDIAGAVVAAAVKAAVKP